MNCCAMYWFGFAASASAAFAQVSATFQLIEDPVTGYVAVSTNDMNGDGVLDFFDISGFLAGYSAGCP